MKTIVQALIILACLVALPLAVAYPSPESRPAFHFFMQPVGQPKTEVLLRPQDTYRVPLPKVFSDFGWSCEVNPEMVASNGQIARSVVCTQDGHGEQHTSFSIAAACEPHREDHCEDSTLLAVGYSGGKPVVGYHLTIKCESGRRK